MKKKMIIIGAGLNGLASAALCAKDGYEVRIFDKHPVPGGVAQAMQRNGYTFDMGPTWYLMPEVYENFFKKLGKSTKDYFDLMDLNPSYKVYFENEEPCLIRRELQENMKTFDTFEKDGGVRLEKYLKNSALKYDIAVNKFLYSEFKSILDFLNYDTIVNGLKLNIFSKLDKFVSKYFKNHRSKKVVEFNTVFLGSSPFKIPALYSLMTHADLTEGVFYPKGGIAKLVEALFQLCQELGVHFFLDKPVEKIITKNNQATGILCEDKTYNADVVLSTIDYHHAEQDLLERKYRNYSPQYWDSRVWAPATLIIYLGVDKRVSNLEHHNFYFAGDWETHFRQIFGKPDWPRNPSFYIGCPTKTDETMAPPGCENLFILVPLAPGMDDTDEKRQQIRDFVIEKLEHLIGEKFSSHIETEIIISHRDFSKNHNYYKGTALGISHTLFQTAFFRPRRNNKKISNLFYSGHNTQPGIGMPMAFIGAEQAFTAVKKWEKSLSK